jgi:hypothetical protein
MYVERKRSRIHNTMSSLVRLENKTSFVKKTAQSKQSPNRLKFAHSGTDVMIFKIFLPKNLAKILAFFAQTTASFCKKIDHNIVFFRKTPIFSPKIGKNRRKV